MTPKAFWKLCRSHDWFHPYSDDHGVWLRGNDNERNLAALAANHPELAPTLQQWADWRASIIQGEHGKPYPPEPEEPHEDH